MASGNKIMLNKDPMQARKKKFPIVFFTGLILCAILAGIWGVAQSGGSVPTLLWWDSLEAAG
jgi:hypothetical protein